MANNNTRVTFDEPGGEYRRPQQRTKLGAVTNVVIKLGLAKNEKQAGIVLIVIAAVAIVIAVVFWPGGNEYELVPQPGQNLSGSN